jgi:predicted TIM-barrel enzyme
MRGRISSAVISPLGTRKAGFNQGVLRRASPRAARYAGADGAIVGTSIQRDGVVDKPVDPVRAGEIVRAFKG